MNCSDNIMVPQVIGMRTNLCIDIETIHQQEGENFGVCGRFRSYLNYFYMNI